VQDVQVVRPVGGEQRRDKGVRHRFERAVRQREDEGSQIQEQVRRGLRLAFRRRERDECGENVEQERGDDELPVADTVDDHAADDDAETEAGEPGAADGAELGAREPEVSGPTGQNAAANAESNAGGENGQEAGPEETLGVRRDCFVAAGSIRHGPSFRACR
jgi:hypothetical protein